MQRILRSISLLTIFLTACASLPGHEQDAGGHQLPELEEPPSSTGVPQGRQAVEFYNDLTPADRPSLRLSDKPVPYPQQPVDRLQPLFELGDPFLGPGPIRPGIKTPTGQMLQPWFLLYGTMRSAMQSFDSGEEHVAEWVNRLDLHGNLNLSGTERLVFSMRPLDWETGDYTGYNFSPSASAGWQQEFNARLTQLFFEGDIGEIFPNLDPTDSKTWDIGFSVGRQSILVQEGLLVNDIIDAVGITRNSLVFDGISNLRLTGIYGWNHLNRGNNNVADSSNENGAQLFGLLSEADTAWGNTVSLDVLYVEENDQDAWYLGASSTQRFGALNTTFRVNASIPQNRETPAVGKGVILLSELSSTLKGSDDLAYFNAFWNICRFTSAARARDRGNPVGNLGILYAPVGMGRYRAPLGQPIDDTLGVALGYQMYLGDSIDKQLIMELGGRTRTKGGGTNAVVGFGARYQHAIDKRYMLRLDAFAAGREGIGLSYGLRTELMIKF